MGVLLPADKGGMLDWLCMNVPEDDLPPKFKVWRTPFSSLPYRQTALRFWAANGSVHLALVLLYFV
jgi:hypothetical protein